MRSALALIIIVGLSTPVIAEKINRITIERENGTETITGESFKAPVDIITVPLPAKDLSTSEVNTKVVLGWFDQSVNETGFVITRTPGGEVGDVGADVRTWTDADVQPNTVYKYTVASYNTAGRAAATAPVQIQTRPPPVTQPADPAASVLTPDSGWAGIKPGKTYLLKAGTYKPIGASDSSFNGCTFVSEVKWGAVFKGQQGKYNFDGSKSQNVVFNGVVFSGGGTDKKFNDKAGVILEASSKMVDCITENMWGVGYNLGNKCEAIRVESRNNGSAAAGAKGDGWVIDFPYWHDCNFQTKDTDGGGIKATRSTNFRITNGRIEHILGAAIWTDINNGQGYIAYNKIKDCDTPTGDKPWLGNGIKCEIDDPGNTTIEYNEITRTHGPGILLEESPGMIVRYNKIDTAYGAIDDKDAIHFRQNTRSDTVTNSRSKQKPPKAWQLRDADIYGNGPATDGADLVLGTSGANKPEKIDLKYFTKYNIKIHDNQNQTYRNIK